ncbi:MAG: GGDEF domain-containing protein [Frankiales bacterium]|nr:MAG: GGDEF domain-containing protein [Frankiales bacterium]
MTDEELRAAARVSGMRGKELPSFEQVERRRFELWLMSTLLLIGVTGAMVLFTTWDPEEMSSVLRHPVARFAMLAVPVALSGYTIEKEMSLRRVSSLLMDERLLTTALTNRLHEISALLDAGRAVNSTLELDRVLDSILSGATDLLPASSGSVMLLDGDELVVAAAVGNAGALGRRAALGDGIAGHVARTREPLLIDGRATSALFPGLVRRSGGEVRSALCVPLLERGELLGVLNLSAPGEGDFSEYDLRAVSLFAEQAATAIGKARLYERSQQQAEQLARAASHDALTGLANRAALDARMTGTRGGETLLFLDLDGFKEVNDELGHAAGDEVLVAVAGRLRSCVGGEDMVGRFGGDEFAILLSGVREAEAACAVASRVLAVLQEPIAVQGRRVAIDASIGIAVPLQEDDGDALLQHADRALYAAKAAGKGCWRVHQAPPVLTPGRASDVPTPRSADVLPLDAPVGVTGA